MFKPKYSLTNNLVNNISQIGRLYGQIEALNLPQNLQLNLNRANLIQSSYASNKIEGNPLTLPEVTNLILDDRVPTNRDEKEVVNYFELLKDLDALAPDDFSLSLVLKIHQKLLQGVHKQAGKIRNQKVVVGKYKGENGNVPLTEKHDPPFHKTKQINTALTQLFNWVNAQKDIPAVLKAGIFHHQFVYVHPFEDGNGRVCRLMSALIFLQNNYLINKYFVLDDYYDIDRLQYSDALNSADQGDKTKWLEYFTDGVRHSLQSALSKAKTATDGLGVKNRPSPKEFKVLDIMQKHREVTSTQLADILNVSRQQAHNLLKSLVDKGFISRVGSTKSSFYVLK